MKEFTLQTVDQLENRLSEIKAHFGEYIGKAFEDAIKTDFAYGKSSLPFAEKMTEELIAMNYVAQKASKDIELDKELRSRASFLSDRIYPVMRQAYVMRDTYVNDAFKGDYKEYRGSLKQNDLEEFSKEFNKEYEDFLSEKLKKNIQISIDIFYKSPINDRYMGTGKVIYDDKTEVFGFEQITNDILLGQGDTLCYEDRDLTGLISEYKDEIRKAIIEKIENEKTKGKEEKPEREDVEEEYER